MNALIVIAKPEKVQDVARRVWHSEPKSAILIWMKPAYLRAIVLGLLCVVASTLFTVAVAQTPDTAALHGTVVGPDGKPLPGAAITIEDLNRHVIRTVHTDAKGNFAAQDLPPGTPLTVTASSPLAVVRSEPITLPAGTTVGIDIQMQIQAKPTEVHVTGSENQVRTDEPQLGVRLTAAQAKSMPLLNRRITALPMLNSSNRPALNQGDVFMNQFLFTANGTGRRQTWFEVDGASANDMWGRQTIFTNVPLDAVSEMTVLDNAFAADYGFGEGAVINIVTRSGSDQYHGNALGLWRPSAPEAKLSGFSSTSASSGNDITKDTLAQGAATLSGPLMPGAETYFLASGEYSYQNRASPVTSPVAPGNYVGHYRDWLGSLRLDHAVSPQQHAFLRLGFDRFHDTNPNGTVGGNSLPSVARVFHRKTYTAELDDTATLNGSMVNDARLQFQLASPITQFSPVVYGTQYVVPISSGGTFTSGTSQSALLMNRQFEAVDTVTASWGRNTLDLGFDVIHARSGGNGKENGGPIYKGQLVYNTCTQSTTYCESSAYLDNIANVQSYTQSFGNANYLVNDTLAAVFAQENTRLTPDFTLNVGLRYELQTFTDSRLDFAPRVGFAYNMAGHGTTTIRGGFGIYDAQVVDNSQANYALTGPTGVFNYTAAPGQVGFPTSVSQVPLPAFPAGAAVPLRSLYIRPGRASYYNQFFPTGTLIGYPNALKNPYNEQWTLGFQRQLAPLWVLSADYLGSHTVKIVRPLDVDAPVSFIRTQPGEVRSAQAANCTRPYWIWWFTTHNATCNASGDNPTRPPYSVIQSDVNDGMGYYEALELNLNYRATSGSALLASYTYSHALDTVDPDIPSQNPNDPRMTGIHELGNAIFDQRHRAVVSGVLAAPFGFTAGGIATFASGLPYNYVTGLNNSGDIGATTDRPVINGQVVARNTGRGTPIYDVSPFLGKRISVGTTGLYANLRAEAFNVLNHRNFVGFSGTYGNGAVPGPGFGAPLPGITNQLPARELQFSAQIGF